MKKILVTAICAATFIAAAAAPGDMAPETHDPVMARGEDGRYYLFATGMGVSVKSTDDFRHWRQEAPVFQQAPAWAVDSVEGYRGHTWAPDIIRANGMWHLYYSCSTFGKNGSAIGHAVNPTLDPADPSFKWTDLGSVVVSHRNVDNWNAIDPNLVIDTEGRAWLTFGSFWDGIQLMELSTADLHTPLSSPVTIARRRPSAAATMEEYREEEGVEAGDNAIEAPFVFRHGDWYYLFVSHDYCCRGELSTYKTVYGRSRNADGPYVDREGRDMASGGGTLLAGPDHENYGIGHCSVYLVEGKPLFFAHAYVRAKGGEPRLFMRELSFDSDGWIVAAEENVE